MLSQITEAVRGEVIGAEMTIGGMTATAEEDTLPPQARTAGTTDADVIEIETIAVTGIAAHPLTEKVTTTGIDRIHNP